jgi:hypothetical protein
LIDTLQNQVPEHTAGAGYVDNREATQNLII